MWLAAGNWRLALISRILLADSNSLSSSEAITNTVNNLKMVLLNRNPKKLIFSFPDLHGLILEMINKL